MLLVTQGANDLNLSFVVEERHADRLLDRLHSQVFGDIGAQNPFGPTYRELVTLEDTVVTQPWWRRRHGELLALKTPSFAYDAGMLKERSAGLRDTLPVDRIFYAMKACSNPGGSPRILRGGTRIRMCIAG